MYVYIHILNTVLIVLRKSDANQVTADEPESDGLRHTSAN